MLKYQPPPSVKKLYDQHIYTYAMKNVVIFNFDSRLGHYILISNYSIARYHSIILYLHHGHHLKHIHMFLINY